MYHLVTWGLVVIGLAVLLPPVVSTEDTLWPTEFGYLRRGGKGALVTALATMRKDRLVAFGRNGVRQTDKTPPAGDDPFRRAVYNALYTPAALHTIATRSAVRKARAELAERLAGYGLIAPRERRWFGRVMLLVAPVVALAGLVTGRAGALAFGFAVLATGAGLWLSRRTIAGHLTVRALRRGHRELLGGLTARGLEGVTASSRGLYRGIDHTVYGIAHVIAHGNDDGRPHG